MTWKDTRCDRTSQSAGARGRTLPFAAGAGGIALILLVYHAFTWRSFTGSVTPFSTLFCDFVDYYYPMGEAVLRSGVFVEGFLYSPFVAILLAAFPPLGLSTSLVLWGILQILFIICYLLLFRLLVPAGLPIQFLFVFLVLTSYPLLLNFIAGSVSVFIIVPLLGLLLVKENGRYAFAAGLLAFAVSFKFFPFICIAPFAARRDTRFLLYAAAACVALLLVFPFLFLGIGDTLDFYGSLLQAFRNSGWVTANPHSQYFPHYLLRLLGAAGSDTPVLLLMLRWIGYGLAAANMGFILLIQRARLRHADLWCFQIALLTIPFFLKTSWSHDFVFLSFTQPLLAWHLLEGERDTSSNQSAGNRVRARTVGSLFLLLPSIIFSNIFFFNLVGDFTLYGFCGFLFWANLFLLIAIYVQFLPPALRGFHQTDA